MYQVDVDPEAQPEVEGLPRDAALAFQELRVALETSPHTLGRSLRETPTANMRATAFGPDRRGLVYWYVVGDVRRVWVVRVFWI